MKRFDIGTMPAYGRGEKSRNVLYETPEFKMRIIALGRGERIPECEMSSYVVFICVEGEADIRAGEDRITLSAGQAVVSEPSTLSMESASGARLLGVQIMKEGRR